MLRGALMLGKVLHNHSHKFGYLVTMATCGELLVVLSKHTVAITKAVFVIALGLIFMHVIGWSSAWLYAPFVCVLWLGVWA